MKQLLKNVVLLVIGLLAAQPVLSSLNCVAGMVPACAPGCPMAMSIMAPDCPMSGMSAAEGCSQSCCTQNAINAVLPRTAPEKSKVLAHSPVALITSVYAAAGFERQAAVSLDVSAETPPRHILHRVFRI